MAVEWKKIAFADHNHTDADLNTVIGPNALVNPKPSTGRTNVAIGVKALNADLTGRGNVVVGPYCADHLTAGNDNVVIGLYAAHDGALSNENVLVGSNAGRKAAGHSNVAVGYGALYNNTSNKNLAVGRDAGYKNVTGTRNVFVGPSAGYYETGSDKLFIDNLTRTDEATARAKAMIYGVFHADPAYQYLTINAKVTISQNLKVGSDATITEFDTGALADLDTVVPTSKAVKAYADGKATLAEVKADADISSAISLKHAAVTIDGTSPLSLSGQAISLKNDAAAAITEVDTGTLANSDTVVPTSKAVYDAIAAGITHQQVLARSLMG
jgi:hypothetical protein